jgi:hypothetical protein
LDPGAILGGGRNDTAIRQKGVPGTREYLDQMAERHWRRVAELREQIPDPAAALDEFVRAHFDWETVEEVRRRIEEGDDELDDW